MSGLMLHAKVILESTQVAGSPTSTEWEVAARVLSDALPNDFPKLKMVPIRKSRVGTGADLPILVRKVDGASVRIRVRTEDGHGGWDYAVSSEALKPQDLEARLMRAIHPAQQPRNTSLKPAVLVEGTVVKTPELPAARPDQGDQIQRFAAKLANLKTVSDRVKARDREIEQCQLAIERINAEAAALAEERAVFESEVLRLMEEGEKDAEARKVASLIEAFGALMGDD